MVSFRAAFHLTTTQSLGIIMTIQVGDKIPEGVFKVMKTHGPGAMSTKEIFSGKKVVLFSVIGAYTTTCSNEHLPGYIEKADELTSKGVDTIACLSVNDVFVMAAWGEQNGVGDKLILLADGSGDYTRALGLELDLSSFGMGIRSQRFAMVIDDGVITQLHIEAPKEFKVSSAEYISEQL